MDGLDGGVQGVGSARCAGGVLARVVRLLQLRHQTKVAPTSPRFARKHYSQLVQDEWSDAAVDSRGQLIPEAAGLQTNNPGWPGFSSEGLLVGGGDRFVTVLTRHGNRWRSEKKPVAFPGSPVKSSPRWRAVDPLRAARQ